MKVRVGIGFLELPLSSPQAYWRWVDICEAGGIDSIWQSDRLVTRRPMLECMSVMAALAGATKKMKFGMSVASVGLREPVLLAKQCATIDWLSNGRMLPAFGIGSPQSEDWKGLGVPTAGRGKRTDEALDIIAALWTGERVDYQGEYFNLDGAQISPEPVQKRFPLWLGGSSKAAIRRTARIGTGWLGGRETPAETARVVRSIKQACSEAGRNIDLDHYGSSFNFRFGSASDSVVQSYVERTSRRVPDRDPLESLVVGDRHAMVARIKEYTEAGITKFVLRPVGADDDDICQQTKRLADEVLPEVDGMDVTLAA